jgi:hypothetical protein
MHAARITRLIRSLGIAGALVGLVACAGLRDEVPAGGSTTPADTAASQEEHAPLRPSIEWERPFGKSGPEFAGAASVNAVLPFKMRMPSFGQPDLIQTIPPDAVPASEQVVALVFHLTEEGTILLKEQLPGEMSLKAFETIASAHAGEPADSDDPTDRTKHIVSPGAEVAPAYQIVEVRGTSGLLVQGYGIGRIIWIEDGILFDMTGPSVTPTQVLALAEAMEA